MATILPFKGIRYNFREIKSLSEVTTPPYDIISEAEQKAYYDRHPFNIIRLDKAKTTENDTPSDNAFTRAAADFKDWQAKKILIRDPEPAFYLTTVEFPLDGTKITRYGLMTRVRLEPFSKKVILPHEETFSKVKSERLELMKACHANFSPIFSIYSDREGALAALKSAVSGKTPEADFSDDYGHRHRMWRILNPAVQQQVTAAMQDLRLYIADGHHRYETALNYREWVKQNTPDFDETHPANFIMMYLCAIEDPGLIILPTHRLLSGISDAAIETLLREAATFFDIREVCTGSNSVDEARTGLTAAMTQDLSKHTIGVVLKNRPGCYALSLKEGVMDNLFAEKIAKPLQSLDVTVLTHLILIRMLGIDPASLDNEKFIAYTSKMENAISSVHNGQHDIAFILNPATNEQVQKIAETGLTMPRKTTYYYPKAITGHVINALTA